MTTNQIAFARQKEEGRHNLETERQGRDVIAETNRHNIATENIGYANVGAIYAQVEESRRHNVATERLNWYEAGYRAKNLKAQSALYEQQTKTSQAQADSLKRQAAVSEFEAKTRRMQFEEAQRHNKAVESYSRYNVNQNVDIAWYNAYVNRDVSDTLNWFREQQVQETRRHNVETERVAKQQAEASSTQATSSIIGTIFGRSGIVGGIGSLLGG